MSPPVLRLREIRIADFRNVQAAELAAAARLNVVSGRNGQGKTSLLEAIYFAATSRSFRTSKPSELHRHDTSTASVRAAFIDDRNEGHELERIQVASLTRGRSRLRIDGNAPASVAQYATRSPVVVFHPDELALSHGPASLRRRLLDRIALYLEPRAAAVKSRYTRALKERQRALKEGASDTEVDAFEDLAARYGAELVRVRRRASETLLPHLLAAFEQIADPALRLGIAYETSGSEDENTARRELRDARPRDSRAPQARFGPHRDELALSLGGHEARKVASQGQHRAITLSLKASEAECLTQACGVRPLLLLDDVSSELDPDRTDSLFQFLGETAGQIFLTTTRPELIPRERLAGSQHADFIVENGDLRGPPEACLPTGSELG